MIEKFRGRFVSLDFLFLFQRWKKKRKEKKRKEKKRKENPPQHKRTEKKDMETV